MKKIGFLKWALMLVMCIPFAGCGDSGTGEPDELEKDVSAEVFYKITTLESLPELSPEDQAYMQKKYERIMEKLPEIDRLLGETAEGWKVSRMGKTDLTVLRLAVYEMEFDEDVPVGVAVNEAVELSKKFGGDGSPAFVNGILGKIGKMEAAE